MPLLRRITALVASLLVLQLTLAAGLDACDEVARVGAPSGGLATSAMDHGPRAPDAPTMPDDADCGQHAPADHGGAPTHCATMVTCTAVIVASAGPQAAVAAAHSGAPAPAPAGTIISRTIAPELPPPRA